MEWPRIDVAGRVVVITGAARGMGMACTRELLAEGAKLVGLDRSWDGVDTGELERSGSGLFLTADVTNDEQLDAAYDETMRAFGTVDVLINNAAILPRFMYPPLGRAEVLQITDEEWQRALGVNTMGPLKVTRRFVRPMLEKRSGHIINVSSPRSWMDVAPDSGEQPYMATKAALTNYSFYLSHDLKPYNIAVNIVFPTGARTTDYEMMANERRRLGLQAGTPMEPEYIVPLILFLAQFDGSYGLTGRALSAVQWNVEHGFGSVEHWNKTHGVPAL